MEFFSKVTGAGSGFPETVMSNRAFENFLDTSDEWIRTRTGIENRRIVDPNLGESTVSLCEKAARAACQQAGLTPSDLQMIVVGTVSPDTVMPCVANQLQSRLGCAQAFTFDLSAACSGFLYGLGIADSMIRTGQIENAVVIGGETLSSLLDWSDRGTCILFGDGAGAAVVQRTTVKKHSVLGVSLRSDGRAGDLLSIPHGYSKVPPWSAAYSPKLHKIKMQGSEVFKLAVRSMVEDSTDLLKKTETSISDVDFFIFHQANIRIVDMCLKTLGVDRSKTWINLDKYGNTSAATLPVCLDEAWKAGKVGPGSLILMSTFGGGLTWGSALIRL